MRQQELERQMDKLLQDLLREVGDAFPPEQVRAVGYDHYERLRREATINDFIPLLVYRYAKADLVHGWREDLHEAA